MSCNNENTICYIHGLCHVSKTRLLRRILYIMKFIYALIRPHFKKVSVYAIKTISDIDTYAIKTMSDIDTFTSNN